jgi:hypothetical protein
MRMAKSSQLRRIAPAQFELPIGFRPGMRVPVRVFGSEKLVREMDGQVFEQAANVASLPGIVEASFCMPDAHRGYGFPIGGVAAIDPRSGVISPGGIGFDINCGMRLVRTDLRWPEVRPRIRELVDLLAKRVPAGVGAPGFIDITRDEFREALRDGSRWALRNGFATEADLAFTESAGCFAQADPDCVSERAIERGYRQIGTLGSGNHYLEVQVLHADGIFDRTLAETFGLTVPEQVVVMFHCGSHGSEVKVLEGGKLDPATWPNTGIGRINPDGSEGACSACHSRHSFSAYQARHPDNCGKCHMGPDHPQKEIYYESKHGIAFLAHKDKLNMESSKWVVGEDYHLAPTCATCHMSATPARPAAKNRAATPAQAVTHDVGMRISWNNRPAVSVRPEVSDKKMGLPGAEVNWETRRGNMKNVCINCHEQQWVDNFYVQYDGLIDLYHDKFAKPGLDLYNLAKPLMRPVKFSNQLDWTWFEIWHHEGRRARHGASMMGPDYTHWHGTYEIAKHFYTKMLPELEHLARDGKQSGDEAKEAAAETLEKKIDEVLNSANHRWYLGKQDASELDERKKRQEEFKKRYD